MSISDEENMMKPLQTLENNMEKRGKFRCHRKPELQGQLVMLE